MRMRLLTALIAGSTFATGAYASGDDSCYPRWSMLKENLSICSSLAFLSPGNDSQVNLRLLLADKGVLALNPQPLNATDLEQGYGPVPFAASRLNPVPAPVDAAQTTAPDPLAAPLERLRLTRPDTTAGAAFLSGEGSRCRSNDQDSAALFINQVLESAGLTDAERESLADTRLQMLDACSWEPGELERLIPGALASPTAQAFTIYLYAAGDFYSGRFAEASKRFASLANSNQPWLQQTAAYMSARTALNHVQETAFNEYSELDRKNVDPVLLQQAEQGFEHYLATWPDGQYAVSAKGLLRRVHWLGGNFDQLAGDFAGQLAQRDERQRNLSLDELINEVDLKLLMVSSAPLQDPMLMAISDLMRMRDHAATPLTQADLQAQSAVFAGQPDLHEYLLAAHALYVQNDPEQALKHLPEAPAANERLDYLGLSRQILRGLALEGRQDWKGAQQTWLSILPQAQAPLQREQLELALAMSFERDEQLARVFAADSPIQSRQVRNILLSHVGDAELLRQQASNGLDASERNLALFVLLYKDLIRGRYADFAEDLKRLPSPLPDEKLGYGLGYVYDAGPSLALFQWQGDKSESGYTCPTIVETAATLQANASNAHALNCLGEFILRNRLDGMPLDQRRDAETLGGSAPGFSGAVFSRLDGYRQVIADPKTVGDHKAYALFRAINCYAPAGYNSCGGQEVEPSVRKGWFRQLKSTYATTQWGKTLQYYW